MALIYNAQLTPGKLDIITAWAPNQPWWQGDPAHLEILGAYRFDDPAGEVGIETHLVRAGTGPVHQIPLTYRSAPQAEADLLTTMDHSVLGERWVYDACTDPVYVAALTAVILSGDSQAELLVQTDGGFQPRRPTTRAQGSGGASGGTLVVRRALDGPLDLGDVPTLTGVWPGQDDPVVLAYLI